MKVEGRKIMRLIAAYGASKGYAEKSYLKRFTEDFSLNYNQWNAYTRDAQVIGLKVFEKIEEIFPDINWNWLFRDENEPMFYKELTPYMVNEPEEVSEKDDLISKLNAIHADVRKILEKGVSDTSITT